MISFTRRNLLLFFKDKSAVFFSLLSSIIILGLYILFLGDVWATNFSQIPNAREIMDNWVMAGLLATTSATTTMGAFGIMVNDRTLKINRDLYVSPISRKSLAGGYVLSAFIIGYIMSLITLVLAEVYIVAEGGSLMTPATLLKVLVYLLIADIANTSMIFLLTSFFSSNNAFSAASTVIGTLIGFITGIYLPIGSLPEAVQWVVKVFPTSHAAVILRQAMMSDPMSKGFSGIPGDEVSWIPEFLGVTFKFGESEISEAVSIAVLLGSGLIFFVGAVLVLSRKKKS